LADTGFAGQALRLINGSVAGWLGYAGAILILNDSALALGVAAGFGVLGFLLPRLAALGVIVALAVALLRGGPQYGLGFSALLPAIGLTWVAAGSAADGGVRRAPLSPLIAIPLAAIPLVAGGLGAGIPLLFGALMRPLGAVLCSILAAVLLVGHDIFFGDGLLPYVGVKYIADDPTYGPGGLVAKAGRIVADWEPLLLFFGLWGAMGAVVSLAEWAGRPLVGVALAVVGGTLAYAVLSGLNGADPGAFAGAMISLVLAGIIYGVARYLGSRG
jgi:hypothetical protein